MTFRIDDLMVAVLPAHMSEEVGCHKDTKTGTETDCNDILTVACPPVHPAEKDICRATKADDAPDAPKEKERAWREEQFALLSRELEDALAR